MKINGFIVLVHNPKDEVVMLENKGITIPLGHQIKLIVSKKHTSLQVNECNSRICTGDKI